MPGQLKNLLDELEQKADYAVQQKIIDCHKRALNWEETDRLPLVVAYPYPASAKHTPFPHHEIFSDPEKMLFNELVHAFDTNIYLHDTLKDDLPYTLRANFGTVLAASLSGGRVEGIHRKSTLADCRHADSTGPLARTIDNEKRRRLLFPAGCPDKRKYTHSQRLGPYDLTGYISEPGSRIGRTRMGGLAGRRLALFHTHTTAGMEITGKKQNLSEREGRTEKE